MLIIIFSGKTINNGNINFLIKKLLKPFYQIERVRMRKTHPYLFETADI